MRKVAVLAVAVAVIYAGGHAVSHVSTTAAPVAGGSNEALANSMAASGYGWTGSEATCLDELWIEESGFSATAVNASSGATGIPQLLPSAHAVPADWSNPRVQVSWGLTYIHDTYGSPCAAWQHEKSTSPNWY